MIRPLVDATTPKMDKAIEHLEGELMALRTGRASTALVENLMIDLYGTSQPLKAAASIATPDARTIAITPWDKGALASIEKAIRENQSLGLNPSNDGQVIRLSVPSLTEDRRREIVKTLGVKIEECKISLRNVRQDTLREIKRLEKDKQVTQDDTKFAENELNKKIDLYHKKIEAIETTKSAEIMSI